MKQTTNYKFNKPELTDLPDITELNQNFDTIDTELKVHDDEIEELGEALSGKADSSHSHTIGDLPLASVAEAKAGSIDTKVMTPAKAKESALAFGMAIKGTNPITSTADDTPVKWGQLGAGTYYFTQTGCLIDQPNQYGFLINHNNGSEVFQLFKKQNSGSMYYRSGNASGWGETWTKCANTADLGAYLPLAGGTMTGPISRNGNLAVNTRDDSYMQICGGKTSQNGGTVAVYGVGHSTMPGAVVLTDNGNTPAQLQLVNAGITHGGKNLVKSVNGVSADAAGNVQGLSYTDSVTTNVGQQCLRLTNPKVQILWGYNNTASGTGKVTISFHKAFKNPPMIATNAILSGDNNALYQVVANSKTASSCSFIAYNSAGKYTNSPIGFNFVMIGFYE